MSGNESRKPELDAERIAALIDGRLSGDERADVLRALDADSDAFAIYADALAVQSDTAAESTPHSARVRSVGWRSPRSLLVAGALLAAAAAAFILILPRGDRATFNELLQTIPPTTRRALPSAPEWDVARGQDATAGTAAAQAIRIGAQFADLWMLARANDTATSTAARRLSRSVSSASPLAAPVSAALDRVAAARDSAALFAALNQATEEAGAVLDAASLRLGAWLDAARAAALRRDQAFFDRADSREFSRTIPSVASLTRQPNRDWNRLSAALDRELELRGR